MNRTLRASLAAVPVVLIVAVAAPYLREPTPRERALRDCGELSPAWPEPERLTYLQTGFVKCGLAGEVLGGRRPILPVVRLFRELNARQPPNVRESGRTAPDPDVWAGEQLLSYAGSDDRLGRMPAADVEAALAALRAELEWERADPGAYGPIDDADLGELDGRLRAVDRRLERERAGLDAVLN